MIHGYGVKHRTQFLCCYMYTNRLISLAPYVFSMLDQKHDKKMDTLKNRQHIRILFPRTTETWNYPTLTLQSYAGVALYPMWKILLFPSKLEIFGSPKASWPPGVVLAPNMETFSGWDFSHFFQVDLELLSTCCSIWLTEFSCSLLTGARLNLTVLDLFRYVPAPTHSLPKAGGGFSFLSHAGYFPGLAPIPMYSTLRILDQAIWGGQNRNHLKPRSTWSAS